MDVQNRDFSENGWLMYQHFEISDHPFLAPRGHRRSKMEIAKIGSFFSLNVPTRSPKNGHFESKSMMKIFKISDFHVFFHFSSENRLFRLWKLIRIRQNHKGKSFISGFEKITWRSIGEKRPKFVFKSDFFFKKWPFSFFSILESGIRFSGTRESVQNWSSGGRDYYGCL